MRLRIPRPNPVLRTVLGACAAAVGGLAIGGAARTARASIVDDAAHAVAHSAERSAVGVLLSRGTAALHALRALHALPTSVVVEAALVATVGVACYAATRAFRLWRAERTTAAPVHALAESGLSRADIARRTGLSRDAVALSLHIASRRG